MKKITLKSNKNLLTLSKSRKVRNRQLRRSTKRLKKNLVSAKKMNLKPINKSKEFNEQKAGMIELSESPERKKYESLWIDCFLEINQSLENTINMKKKKG